MSSRFTERAELALNKSVSIAEGLGHNYIGTEHVLIAITEDEGACAAVILRKNGIGNQKITDMVKSLCGIGKRTRLTSKDTTPRCRKILENSYKISKRYSSEKIGTEHLLMAIIEEGDSVAMKILQSMGISVAVIRDDVLSFLRSSERIVQSKKAADEKNFPYLKKYAINLTKKAREKGFDPVIGREVEINKMIRILSRRTKNNPCLIGEAGVGKTAVVEGLAQQIADKTAPYFLSDKSIYAVDFTSMVAGAKYRGDFEERIKGLIEEARSNENIILFVDEIHTIVGAGAAEGAIDAANIMKPELARGDIQVIGATTPEEYRKYIEKDSALERRFQPVVIDVPTRDKTIEILMGLKEKYEDFHHVNITPEALIAATDLSIRYINDRFLPDKAIDLLDEACAIVGIKNAHNKKEHFHFSHDNSEQIYYDADLLYNNLLPDIQEESVYNMTEEDSRPIVSAETVRELLNDIIGNCADEDSSLEHLPRYLSDKIIGQDRAIASLTDCIRRCSSGLCDPERPLGIFMFIGESGVGKTELAKACATALFHDQDSLTRIDMSEYSESYSISKLIGSAPGYVGFDNGGSAFEKIRKRNHGVLLLDEIEKAHPDVISLFLQIFDYGFIKDSAGRQINFRNTYIIMTSNVCVEHNGGGIGFMSGIDDPIAIEKGLKKHFRAEFVNRIDEIISFNKLTETDLLKITRQKLIKVFNRASDRGFDVKISDEVIEKVANLAKKADQGARPVDRLIAKYIESPLARFLVNNSGCEDKKLYFEISNDDITLLRHCHEMI